MAFLPAHATKDHSSLECRFSQYIFHLSQTQTHNNTTGTTLWLGAQCLSAYIAEYHKAPAKSAMRAIELGSGIGLCSLVLNAVGYSTVYATDTRLVIDSVLARNISSNSGCGPGSILVRELDWDVPPERWNWEDTQSIASASPSSTTCSLSLPFDLVVTSDTVYSESLALPLLRALHALSSQSLSTSTHSKATRVRPPLILLCLERRDPSFVDTFLACAREEWGFSTEMVSKRKISKVMQKYAEDWDRDRPEWDGVEIWKLILL